MLIAYEGIDGSGKTTSSTALQRALAAEGARATIVHCKSFQISDDTEDHVLFAAAERLRTSGRLGPLSYAAWHCADFAYRLEQMVLPALERGEIVIMDRYKYTPFVRDVIRGLDEKIVHALYSFAPEPDLVLYLDLDPAAAYARKKSGAIPLGFYESGRDLYAGFDEQASFERFQSLCRARYDKVLPPELTLRLDGSRSPEELNAEILEAVNATRAASRAR